MQELRQTQVALRQAEELLQQNAFEQALALLDTLDTESELGGLICFIRGNVYLRMEQNEQAHLCYGEALKKGFVHEKLYINFGIVKTRMGNPLQAEMMYRQAAQLSPSDALPLNRILLLRLETGDIEGAQTVMEELMDRNPELFDGFHHKADLLLGTNRAAEALALLDGTAQRFLSHPLYVYDRCRALSKTGQDEKALDFLTAREEVFRDELMAELYKKERARLLVRLGRTAEAEPMWADLYALYGDREAGLALAASALGRGDMKELYRLADEISGTRTGDRTHYLCLYYKALALKQMGEETASRQALLAALEEFNRLGDDRIGVELRSLRAAIRTELGQYEAAVADLDSLDALLERQEEEPQIKAEAQKNLAEFKQNILSRKESFS